MRSKVKGKIIIVEGIDRVGKTTLVDMLVGTGMFVKLKDEFINPIGKADYDFANYSYGKCETMYVVAKEMAEQGLNVVIDRMYLTEYIYGTEFRSGHVRGGYITELEDVIKSDGLTTMVYMQCKDVVGASKRAGVNQQRIHDLFEDVMKRVNVPVIYGCYENIEQVFKRVIRQTTTHDIYFASPFFTPEQVEREERLKRILRGIGFTVYSPKENSNLVPNATQSDREKVFSDNKEAIENCLAVFAITDGKDVGTIWEAGYAHAIGKPVIYYAETLGNNQFNLMLAQSGNLIYTSDEHISAKEILYAIAGNKITTYKGEIE